MSNNPEILRTRDLINLLKLSRSTIWRRIKIGNFPKPFGLGGGSAINAAKGWLADDVYSWIEKQKSLTETNKANLAA